MWISNCSLKYSFKRWGLVWFVVLVGGGFWAFGFFFLCCCISFSPLTLVISPPRFHKKEEKKKKVCHLIRVKTVRDLPRMYVQLQVESLSSVKPIFLFQNSCLTVAQDENLHFGRKFSSPDTVLEMASQQTKDSANNCCVVLRVFRIFQPPQPTLGGYFSQVKSSFSE